MTLHFLSIIIPLLSGSSRSSSLLRHCSDDLSAVEGEGLGKVTPLEATLSECYCFSGFILYDLLAIDKKNRSN